MRSFRIVSLPFHRPRERHRFCLGAGLVSSRRGRPFGWARPGPGPGLGPGQGMGWPRVWPPGGPAAWLPGYSWGGVQGRSLLRPFNT